jgi:hypothetical protein
VLRGSYSRHLRKNRFAGGTSSSASSTQACLIDSILSSVTKSGYTFVVTGGSSVPNYSYTVTAKPITVGTSGQRGFYSDQAGVIRYNQSGTATSADNPIQ